MFGSDLMVQQLDALRIEHVAINPGATLRGLHESLLNGTGQVQAITCLHEGVAVGVAHGFAKASGRPMGVGLHDTVGVLNAALGVFNAWADAVPLLIVGGVGPLDTTARRPWIDWVHTTTDTPRPIRDMLVWAETPSSVPAALAALQRGHARARSSLAGPAYVGLDQPIQDAPLVADAVTPLPPGTPWRAGADADLITSVARILHGARHPAIVLDRPLDDDTAARVVAVAEHLDAALVEMEGASNVPWGHRLDRSGDAEQVLAAADAVLLVDVRDPGLVGAGSAEHPARPVIEVSAWSLRESSWMVTASAARVTHRVVAEPALAMAALAQELGVPTPLEPQGGSQSPPMHPLRMSDATPLDKRAMAVAAGASLPRDRVVVAHGSLAGHAREQLCLQRPSQYLGRSGGEGLGYALPAAMGAALAHRGSDRVVVGFLTDGDTLYLPQALWTAAHARIPLLAIVANNRGYGRDALHQRHAARARGRDEERAVSGVRIDDPGVDLATLARSMGVDALGPVDTIGELRAAIARGLDVVADGSPFVIDARTTDG